VSLSRDGTKNLPVEEVRPVIEGALLAWTDLPCGGHRVRRAHLAHRAVRGLHQGVRPDLGLPLQRGRVRAVERRADVEQERVCAFQACTTGCDEEKDCPIAQERSSMAPRANVNDRQVTI
jgi:hypothetical protein